MRDPSPRAPESQSQERRPRVCTSDLLQVGADTAGPHFHNHASCTYCETFQDLAPSLLIHTSFPLLNFPSCARPAQKTGIFLPAQNINEVASKYVFILFPPGLVPHLCLMKPITDQHKYCFLHQAHSGL